MNLILMAALIGTTHFVWGQANHLSRKGQYQLSFALSIRPVQKRTSELNFRYIDGNANSNYLPDTIAAKYNLNKRYFGTAFSLGVGYFVSNTLKVSFNVSPHLNSFLSNKAKNGQVYGAQVDLGLDFFAHLSKNASISYGITSSRILGGFGITSDGAKNKDYLVVNNNQLYDKEIGFHIIDNSWALNPKIGLNYSLSENTIIFSNLGYQITFGRESKMNFAGFLKDGNVKWNSISYESSDVDLSIDDAKINNATIDQLPYRFNGWLFDFGTTLKLNRKQCKQQGNTRETK